MRCQQYRLVYIFSVLSWKLVSMELNHNGKFAFLFPQKMWRHIWYTYTPLFQDFLLWHWPKIWGRLPFVSEKWYWFDQGMLKSVDLLFNKFNEFQCRISNFVECLSTLRSGKTEEQHKKFRNDLSLWRLTLDNYKPHLTCLITLSFSFTWT